MRTKISPKDFKRSLQDVIEPEDEVVLIYSGIWTFGHRFGEPPESLPQLILDCIEEVVGPHRTLLFPTYTYQYNSTGRFDIRISKPETGILPEVFFKRSGVLRSHSAINSFAIKGPKAASLITLKGKSIWGEGSLLEWMDRNSIRIINLGIPWAQSCGYFHRIEELAQVPYRFYKNFPGIFIDETGTHKIWEEAMFVRSLHVPPELDWDRVTFQMEKGGAVLKGKNPEIPIESELAHSIVTAGLETLQNNPYGIVVNVSEVSDWVENGGKEKEIALTQRP